jgi:hypothetical protein
MAAGSRILVTHNGRYGDLIWALPPVRAISQRLGEPVDLVIPGEFASIVPLLQQQPYLSQVWSDGYWAQGQALWPYIGGLAPEYEAVVELGYRGWPEPDCVRHTLETADRAFGWNLTWEELDLETPWITTPTPAPPTGIPFTAGFSETWFELKYGLCTLLARQGLRPCLVGDSGRWQSEARATATSWQASAILIQQSQVFLGCCSALHVLACAVGTPVVLMEPMEARWNPVFYPFGKVGPQVTLVTGNDGLPTFDARAVADALRPYLKETP